MYVLYLAQFFYLVFHSIVFWLELNCIFALFAIIFVSFIAGEDTLLNEQPYHYLTVDEMKSLGDDSLPIDVTQDDRHDSNRDLGMFDNRAFVFQRL